MGGTERVPGYTGTIDELIPLMNRENITYAGMQNFTPVWDMKRAAHRRLPEDLTGEQRKTREQEIQDEIVLRIMRRNDWTCDVAREHSNLLGFIGIDPIMNEKTMSNEVKRCHDAGAVGIKLHTAVQRFSLNDKRLWPAYEAAEKFGTAILAHSGPFQGAGEGAKPDEARDVLGEFPRLNLILAHCGGRPHFEEAIKVANDFPQLAFDCCGLVTGNPEPNDPSDADLVRLFRAIGTDRVMFGTDWPFRDPIPDVHRVLNLPLDDDEKEQILSRNAIRILNLN
jgi:predicted TIM-barrel fold metal-dependent hydrolase